MAWKAYKQYGFAIVFRVLQGLGAAMLAANSPAILSSSFPARQRGQMFGMLGMAAYLCLTVGPSLGGFVTEHLGWQAIFFSNF